MPSFLLEPGIDIFRSLGLASDSPVRHYIGTLDGQGVGASTLFLGAGVAGVYNVSTVPVARRQGIGAAMTSHPLSEARALGYRAGILHASVPGKGVYQSLGFRERCKLGCYMWTPPVA